VFGSGGPIVASRASVAAITIGHGVAAVNMPTCMPKPNVNVNRSRTVISHCAATVSSSGPSIRRSTRGAASSGSSRSTGSSSESVLVDERHRHRAGDRLRRRRDPEQ
jgi:hypothetical protein